MFGERFELNANTLAVVEEIGRHMPGGFFIYKATGDEELLYVNRAAMDIYGCADLDEFKALTGYTFKGMVYPDDYDAISSSIDEQIGTNAGNMDYVEYRIVRKDGAIRWVDDYGHYTDTKEYGGIYYVFISDITEKRERLETDMAVRQAVINALSESYHTVWLISDVETEDFSLYRGDIAGDADEAESLREALNGMKYSDAKEYYIDSAVAESDRERMREELDLKLIVKKLSDQHQFNENYLRKMRDGSEKYFRIEFTKVRMPGGRMGVVCGFKDVDADVRQGQEIQRALREAEQAEARAKQADLEHQPKSQFLFNMSHDIRTPMNAIIGYTNLARKEESSGEVREYLDKIENSSQHLLALINDILEMSRIESGKIELEFVPVDLCMVFEGMKDLFHEQMKEKGIDFSVHTSQIEDRYVWCDRKNLNRVLLNLLSNAYKFTPEGGSVTASIWESGTSENGYGIYEIRVQDTGIGMSREFAERMFNAFERERTSTVSGIEGTGLGLSITKSIVDLMGGTIEVMTAPGSGTEMVIRLRFKLAEEKDVPEAERLREGSAADNADTTSEVDFSTKRLLLVEDNHINMEIANMILTQAGFMVETAENGKIAVDMVAASEPGYYDAILMDIQMPEMDGYEATRAIRAMREPAHANIPILAMTANAFKEDEEAAFEAGMQAHIAKPIDVNVMMKALASVLK